MLSKVKPAAGKLLISEPFLTDPNFKRSVVLIAEHIEEGTLGFILNQPSQFLLRDLVPDLGQADFPVFIGGPVEIDTIHFIHCCNDKLNSGEEIGNGIYWGGNFEMLKILINDNSISPYEVKFFLGYSGWGMAQLDKEIKENSWIVSDQFHQEVVFSPNEEELWKEVIINLGPKFAHVSKFPSDPSLN
jgi:putative transcriptional regulator